MFKHKQHLNLSEIRHYTLDLQKITELRDKATQGTEMAEYDNILSVMREVYLRLNEAGK